MNRQKAVRTLIEAYNVGNIEIKDASRIDDKSYKQMAKDEQMFDVPAPESSKCPHNKEIHECNACMIASDFAYDAMRERK